MVGRLLLPPADLNIFVVLETNYTRIVSTVNMNTSKSQARLNEKLRRRILDLPGVTERQNAGIHEDAFFVGRTMFMHIHGYGHCDIRLAKQDQERVLAGGKARPHHWAPEKGYITFKVRDENDLAPAMELIRMSHTHFANGLH
jgi:Family of unknown function (DUF5519)